MQENLILRPRFAVGIFCWILIMEMCCVQEVKAQRPRYRPQVHELNLQLGSLHLSEDFNESQSATPVLGSNILNGIRYRYHLDIRQGLRLGAFFRTQSFEVVRGNVLNEITDRIGEVRIGYERKYHMRKWQVYGGVDLIFQQNQREESIVSSSSQELAIFRGGGALFAGVRYFPHTHWSFVFESDLNVLGNLGEDSPEGVRIKSPVLGTHLLTFSVAYHFKRMKKNCTCGKPGS